MDDGRVDGQEQNGEDVAGEENFEERNRGGIVVLINAIALTR
jgi:hypothetical protein